MGRARVVLGIDPGYGRMGYAVVSGRGQDATLVDVGCVETVPQDTHAVRLSQIANQIRALFEVHRPDVLCIEKLFFSKNQTTAIAVAESRGVVLAIAGAFTVPVIEIGPKQVKLALTGYGNADKSQVQQMVVRLLNLSAPITPDDAADAAAIAMCGLYTVK